MQRQIVLFLVAIQFLTRLPTPAWAGFQPNWLPQSARYFPLVGVLVGIINVGVWWLLGHWLPAAVTVGVMLAVSLLVTGALHEDGFADACDGFGGANTRDRVLAIMKDSRVGAYGAIGICVMLGLKWTACVAIPAAAFPVMVIGAHMFSRWCACGVIWRLKYARSGEDSKAAPFADGVGGGDWIVIGALGAIGVVPIALLSDLMPQSRGYLALAAAAAAAAIMTVAAAGYFRRRIGGYTGDCLGAVQQLAELAFLLAGLAIVGPAQRTG
ncbi:MAG TPA: adenosylcobinamide-GDP ribazoletransferase [Steroidobacteraceae bacterium]|nr:adenosylcobinamide-GDP ribazoletransferase [Steroidobacteraceae bacterium]